ncbi:aldehyde dehydrogenase family protein, partial [Pseudomonas paraeruginosa]|uniref:aldehyde dehydrogenase family protein n=1 Tax=Pseudomonas paraeruginosa TaxID=2994495 RepID=UPI000A666C6D
VFGGERQLRERYPDAYYVSPAIVEMPGQTEVVRTETFAPILYVIGYRDFDEALRLNNEVPQGLSSCIFTTDLREAERFQGAADLRAAGADVDVGDPAVAAGGGRESGSDAWKAYMRRQTNTVNYSRELPLAQGITFD